MLERKDNVMPSIKSETYSLPPEQKGQDMDDMTKLLLTGLKHWDRWDGEDTISERDEELLRELIEGLSDGSIKLLHLVGDHGTIEPYGQEWRRVLTDEELVRRLLSE